MGRSYLSAILRQAGAAVARALAAVKFVGDLDSGLTSPSDTTDIKILKKKFPQKTDEMI